MKCLLQSEQRSDLMFPEGGKIFSSISRCFCYVHKNWFEYFIIFLLVSSVILDSLYLNLHLVLPIILLWVWELSGLTFNYIPFTPYTIQVLLSPKFIVYFKTVNLFHLRYSISQFICHLSLFIFNLWIGFFVLAVWND